ncbi:hypothetical protein NQ315_000984 [Exocentrus adspersus]|uniref:Uncharacterized protein n=1 Tax=Exocentrus adspersus TaxID=1586481 RepID=A0AAV8WFG7_9CUCU|nr:hypothetical protein NQ315_000984 [Exocentrus adspersus]
MKPKRVRSTLLLGNNLDYTAINLAESGKKVWFVSPEVFDKIPDNIVPPEMQILKLITFIYLKDYKDLLSHLNGIHLWHKIPDIIILSNLDTYCHLYGDNYDTLLCALVVATLLDSASVCAKKNGTSYLISTCSQPSDPHKNKLQVLYDLYFSHVIEKTADSDTVCKDIINYYSNEKDC